MADCVVVLLVSRQQSSFQIQLPLPSGNNVDLVHLVSPLGRRLSYHLLLLLIHHYHLVVALKLKMQTSPYQRPGDGVLILIKRILIRIPFQWDSPHSRRLLMMLIPTPPPQDIPLPQKERVIMCLSYPLRFMFFLIYYDPHAHLPPSSRLLLLQSSSGMQYFIIIFNYIKSLHFISQRRVSRCGVDAESAHNHVSGCWLAWMVH